MMQCLYKKIQDFLEESGVELLTNVECSDLIIEDNRCIGAIVDGKKMYADTVVVSTGRRGASWLEKVCDEHGIKHQPGIVDMGVRLECRNEVMEIVNKHLYEGKFVGYPAPFRDKVRTFCQNPGGFVAQENYDDGLAVVNGHAFKETKSENTNLAILSSIHFTAPFNQPIAYARKVGELTNMLGDGSIMVQRYGDILAGKRTWQKELNFSNVKPTLPDAIAGDITAAMPYRTMTNIINFIKAMDKVTAVPEGIPRSVAVTLDRDNNNQDCFVVSAPYQATWDVLRNMLPDYGFEITEYSISHSSINTDYEEQDPEFFRNQGLDDFGLEEGSYIIRVSIDGERTFVTFYNEDDKPLRSEVVARLYPGFSAALSRAFTASAH